MGSLRKWFDAGFLLCSYIINVVPPVKPSLSHPQVHSLYRRTGASFQKAQQEFSQGVVTSKGFQTAATGAASAAARGTFQGNN